MATAFPSHQDIADRAYSLFQSRGAADGFDLDDWLQAERELFDLRAAESLATGLGLDDELEHEEEEHEGADDEAVAPTRRVALRKSYPRRAAG